MKRSGFTKRVNLATILLLLSASILTVSFTSSTIYAKTEVLFSPRGSIKEAIINNIIASTATIDITAFTFTAGDIAETLYQAKERGVEVRVVIDRKQDAKHYPAIEFLKDEGFDLQFLKGNIGGSMNNTFAIFDSKLLVTGSYTWTEYAEKFNYENAIFTDEQDVIENYKKEFELLYDKSVVQGAERSASSTCGSGAAPAKEKELKKQGNMMNAKSAILEGNPVKFVAKKDTESFTILESDKQVKQAGKTIEEPLKQFVTISFNEFDKMFGSESTLKRSERTHLWKNKFEGKYVKWTGKICFRGFAVYDWNKIGISHKSNNIDVNLRFDYSKQKKVLKLKVGDIVTYTGRLVSLSGVLSSYKLEDVDVVQVVR